MSAELKPCPFCGGAARIESNRDWHRLYADHASDCVLDGDDAEMMYPAMPEYLPMIAEKWNRRALAAPSQPAEPALIIGSGGRATLCPPKDKLLAMVAEPVAQASLPDMPTCTNSQTQPVAQAEQQPIPTEHCKRRSVCSKDQFCDDTAHCGSMMPESEREAEELMAAYMHGFRSGKEAARRPVRELTDDEIIEVADNAAITMLVPDNATAIHFARALLARATGE